MSRRRLLVVGWDGADWNVIDSLCKAGRMPCLARLRSEGCWGNLASLRPCLTPMLWTTVATGMTADRHGVLGFVEAEPSGFGTRTVRQKNRQVRAVWDMLGERDLRSVVIGWPVTGPVEGISGVMVSDRVLETLRDRPEEIDGLPDGLVSPEGLREEVSELRHHPCDFSPWDLREMIPGIGGIDLQCDGRPAMLARALARCATVHNVATTLLPRHDWDFFAVYYDMIDRAGHEFMCYREPQMEGVPDADFQRYGGVMDEVYAFHDAMLGRLLALAGADVGVMLLSDHGFQTGDRRPRYHGPGGGHGGIAEDGADWHRMHGVLLMHGPGIRQGERVFGATLLDMAPTMLGYLGLPAGRDMPGRALEQAVTGELPARIASWESSGPRTGRSRTELPRPLEEAAVRDLVALGYLSEGVADGAAAARQARREQDFNLAVVYLSTARPAQAVTLFGGLVAQAPLEPRYRLGEIEALAALGDHAKVLAAVAALRESAGPNAHAEMAAAAAHFALGDAAMSGRCLDRAVEFGGRHPDVLHLAGQMHLERGRYSLAAETFSRVVEMDAGHFSGLTGLAEAFLELRQYDAALEKAVESLRLAYWNPRCHLVLGRILLETGGYEDAVRAFRLALAQAPRWSSAHHFLAEALGQTGDPVGARQHRALAAECVAGPIAEEENAAGEPATETEKECVCGEGDEILVVTGLPRSGTSLMMQVLAAGGMDVLTDGERVADMHNEGGYHEWEPVKQLPADPEILRAAQGKAVKVVAALLPSLPVDWRYAVICMRRDAEEVEASQRTMLGGIGLGSSVAGQQAQYEASLAWIRGTSGVRVLEVPFREILRNPMALAREVAEFAGIAEENVPAMAAAVQREWSRHSL